MDAPATDRPFYRRHQLLRRCLIILAILPGVLAVLSVMSTVQVADPTAGLKIGMTEQQVQGVAGMPSSFGFGCGPAGTTVFETYGDGRVTVVYGHDGKVEWISRKPPLWRRWWDAAKQRAGW